MPGATQAAAAGTHADSEGVGRLLGFLTTIAGMLVFALMIGVVSESIGARVDDLKRGNSKAPRPPRPCEPRHPLQVAPLCSEACCASPSRVLRSTDVLGPPFRIRKSNPDLLTSAAQVIESGHTLVLGWSEKGLAVLRQLALANMSEGGLPVVVLCSEKKEDMEEMVAPSFVPPISLSVAVSVSVRVCVRACASNPRQSPHR